MPQLSGIVEAARMSPPPRIKREDEDEVYSSPSTNSTITSTIGRPRKRKEMSDDLPNTYELPNKKIKTETSALLSASPSYTPIMSGPSFTLEQAGIIKVEQPEWYTKLKTSTIKSKHLSKEDMKLEILKKSIMSCISDERNVEKSKKLLNLIHELMFIKVTPQLIKDRKMFDHKSGLPGIISSTNLPYYLRLDTEELCNKWSTEIFNYDLMMGIVFKSNSSSSIKGGYKFKKSCNNYGNNDLINGQWWPIQLAMVRDGCHGSPQGGIAGKTNEGAYSVVLASGLAESGERYPNVDDGDLIKYCGTDGKNGVISDNTSRLVESFQNGLPIRVIRSSKCVYSRYRPEMGYRYDGIYKIIDVELLDMKKQRHRFDLIREENQDPIRYKGLEKRPTEYELFEWKKLCSEKKYIVNDE